MRHICTAIVAILVCGPAFAQSTIFEKCISAIESGDTDAVVQFAATIQRLNTISSANTDFANRCVSEALGKNVKFEPRLGGFFDAQELESKRATNDALVEEKFRRAAAQLEAQRAQLEAQRRVELRKELNRSLLAEDIYETCVELYYVDKSRAVLNSLCIESFTVRGHPRLKDFLE